MDQKQAVVHQRSRIERGLAEVCRAAEDEISLLETTRPGLRVVGMRPPPPIRHFQGRGDELDRLASFLSDPGVRVVAIIGRPGMGKTALARKLLHAWEEEGSRRDLPDLFGIVYLSALTAGISFERLYFDCAELLGGNRGDNLREVWTNPALDHRKKALYLLDKLEDAPCIILLDNLENELNEAGDLRDPGLQEFFSVLHDQEVSGGARVLITSQIRIRSGGEHLTLGRGLPEGEALKLLLSIDHDNRLHLRQAPEEQLRQLAASAHGNPRVLELAVSLIGLGQDIAEVIAILEDGDATHPVELLSEANYQRLSRQDPEACRVIEALAVYRRPVPFVAIDWMLESISPGAATPSIVERLITSHTITIENFGELRTLTASISLHPADSRAILRHIPPDDLGKLHLLAAAYYRETRYRGPWRHARQLDPQLREIEHLIAARNFDRALDVLDTIDYSWANHHKYLAYMMSLGLGRSCIELRTQLASGLGNGAPAIHNRTSLGWICRRMGDKKEALQNLEAAAASSLNHDDSVARIFALSELGYFLTDNAARHAEAEKTLLNALEIARISSDRYGEAHSLLGLAFVHFQLQNNAASLQHTIAARDLFASSAAPAAHYREIDCWIRLGMIHRKMGNDQLAVDATSRGRDVAKRHGLTDWEAEACSGLGFHHRAAGRYQDAIEMHQQARKIFAGLHRRREEAVQQSYLANLHVSTGALDDALQEYRQALNIVEDIGLRRELSWIRGNMGIAQCCRGEYAAALASQDAALEILEALGHPDSKAIRYTDRAETYLSRARYSEAEDDLRMALVNASEDGNFKLSGDLPQAYLECPALEDKLPHEMLAPSDHERRGVLLAQIYLANHKWADGLNVIKAAQRRKVDRLSELAALEGLFLARIKERVPEAIQAWKTALRSSEAAIRRSPNLYGAWYIRGLSHAGLAVFLSEDTQASHLRLAGSSYRQAMHICEAPGIIQKARYLFNSLGEAATGDVLSGVQSVLGI